MRIFKLSTLLAFFIGCQTAWSDPIFYEVDDLGDGDATTWQYNYTVGNEIGVDIDWFTIFFDPALYVFDLVSDGVGSIVDPTIFDGPDDWDTFVFPPDDIFGLIVDGEFNGFALVDLIAPGILVDGFSIAFTWLGDPTTTPGSQPFTLFVDVLPLGPEDRPDLTNHTQFTQLAPTVAVSEPGTLALVGIGLLAFGLSRRRSNQLRVNRTAT